MYPAHSISLRPYNLPYEDNVRSMLHFPLSQLFIAPADISFPSNHDTSIRRDVEPFPVTRVSDWVILIGSSDEAMREYSRMSQDVNANVVVLWICQNLISNTETLNVGVFSGLHGMHLLPSLFRSDQATLFSTPGTY
ncbi:hypothetical protein BU17DRAFT_62124 [Hysterangium stoloniferum]|nr:hypothetical protein BU17DRAFT_62124 [Hysterangium stoloniferum]